MLITETNHDVRALAYEPVSSIANFKNNILVSNDSIKIYDLQGNVLGNYGAQSWIGVTIGNNVAMFTTSNSRINAVDFNNFQRYLAVFSYPIDGQEIFGFDSRQSCYH